MVGVAGRLRQESSALDPCHRAKRVDLVRLVPNARGQVAWGDLKRTDDQSLCIGQESLTALEVTGLECLRRLPLGLLRLLEEHLGLHGRVWDPLPDLVTRDYVHRDR